MSLLKLEKHENNFDNFLYIFFQEIDNVYYETEYRREWCSTKGKPSKCFLFARKFTRPAALRLLNTVRFRIQYVDQHYVQDFAYTHI